MAFGIVVLRTGPFAVRSQPSGARSIDRLRILVVDDDDGCRQAVASLLSDEGHEITTAAGGLEALDHAVRSSRDERPFEVSILDCNMPDLNGVETFRRLGDVLPGLEGVFMSGDPNPRLLEELRRAGARAFLEKPLDVPRIRSVVAFVQDRYVS